MAAPTYLPPRILGPISQISLSVRIDGIHDGWTLTVLVDGWKKTTFQVFAVAGTFAIGALPSKSVSVSQFLFGSVFPWPPLLITSWQAQFLDILPKPTFVPSLMLVEHPIVNGGRRLRVRSLFPGTEAILLLNQKRSLVRYQPVLLRISPPANR